MLPARRNPIVQAWFDGWCRRALRRHFYRLHLYPETPDAWKPAAFDPAVPRLYVANHSSFWDGIVLNYVLRRFRRAQPLYCMIDAVQVRKHPFFRRIGGFSVDRANPRDARRTIDYAASLLRDESAAVVIFPQGRNEPNDVRPLRFESGVARLIEAVPHARVVPVALRYEFWLEQRAEAMLAFGAERQYAGRPRREALADLRAVTTRLLDGLVAHGLSYRCGDPVLLKGKSSVSDWRRDLPWPLGAAPADG